MWAAINDTQGERELCTHSYRLMMQICKLVESVQELFHIGIVRVVNSRGFQRIDSKLLSLAKCWSIGSTSLASCCSCEQILVGGCARPSRRPDLRPEECRTRSIVEKE
ncbi:hypothetical protein TNIN_453401 [Trichonephila inaurata madagascariensis]|uniref:Uncharacterized protein n=1 Tax=Trichonephila inaurata madagascariensis TaxID=2747483 RepID=A0A8X6YQD8_9ARAC|nr:hypothetical protein TNIN_453401 [Trichonephila inaurata madagascariensis]